MAQRARRAVAGLFDRAPAFDLEPHPAVSWRAFRHRVTRGLWYARDNEDYTIAMAERCGVCDGTGWYYLCGRCGGMTHAQELSSLCKCPDETGYRKCVVCDGEGVCYEPSPVRIG